MIVLACTEKIGPEEIDDPVSIIWKLNQNVEGFCNLASAYCSADSIAIFSINHNDDGSVRYQLNMKDGDDVDLFSEVVAQHMSVPALSIKQIGTDFYWILNGEFILDGEGRRIDVLNRDNQPSFLLQDGTIFCKVGSDLLATGSNTKADYSARDVSMVYNPDLHGFSVSLSSGQGMMLPTVRAFRFFKEDVLNNSYYKDVFLDAGIGLSSRKTLAAARSLGLSIEGVSLSRSNASEEEIILQNEIISGNKDDMNGRLLYPDGQPRYKLLFVNGGSSTTHGHSLNSEGLENISRFVRAGGSYVGTCAGAFFASNGYDGHSNYPNYLSIWPGMMQHTGLSNTYTGMVIENASPLLDYYDFGGDHYVDSVRHNLGGYPVDLPSNTEVLARYDFPLKKNVHNQPSIWAYKDNIQSGRIILCGSHPEEVSIGERKDLTAAMMQYAIDGRGGAPLKGYLKKGEPRVMDKWTSDNNAAFTRIGDLQTHFFAVYIPSAAKDVSVDVTSSYNCDFALMMNQDTFACSDVAEYVSAEPGAKQRLFFPSIKEGIWFVSVQCLTTVTVEDTDYGQSYFGQTSVLNGVPYTIRIDWN